MAAYVFVDDLQHVSSISKAKKNKIILIFGSHTSTVGQLR
jgi:hypothetical protein